MHTLLAIRLAVITQGKTISSLGKIKVTRHAVVINPTEMNEAYASNFV